MGRHRTAAYVPKVYSRNIKWTYKAKNGEPKPRKSTVHYIRWYDCNGKEHRRTTEFRYRSEAEKYAHGLTEKELRKDEAPSKYKNFGEYASRFFVPETCPILRRKNNRDENYKNKSYPKWTHGQIELHIIKYLGEKTFDEITPQIVQNWLDELPAKNKITHDTANKQLNFLRMIFNEAIIEGLVTVNPCNGVRRLKPDRKARPSFTIEEITRLFSSPWENTIAYEAALAAAGSGARISEILAIKPCKLLVDTDEILFDRSYSTTGEKGTKNDTSETSPVPHAIMSELARFAKGRKPDDYLFSYDGKMPIKREHLYAALYAEMKARGIDRFSPDGEKIDMEKELPLGFHSFRTTINTILLENGVSDYEARKVLRQKSPSSTKFYTDRKKISTTKSKSVLNDVIGSSVTVPSPSSESESDQ